MRADAGTLFPRKKKRLVLGAHPFSPPAVCRHPVLALCGGRMAVTSLGRNEARQPNPSILPARTRGFASLNRPRPVRRITPPTLRGHNHAPAQFGNRRAVL